MERTALIINDDPIICKQLEAELKRNLFSCYIVHTGIDGLGILNKKKIDVLLLDVCIPDIDGLELLKQAKEKWANCEVIIITGYGSLGVGIQALRKGAIDYLEKPINLEELNAALGRALEKLAEKKELIFQSSLLIADDDKEFTQRLKKFLEKEGYLIFTAHDGNKGLEIINTNKIDVILVDIKLPGMDGIQLLEKAKRFYRDIEAIMITGHGDEEYAVKSLRRGAINYLRKPINLEELLIAIKKAIEKIVLYRNQLYRSRELKINAEIISKMNEELGRRVEERTRELQESEEKYRSLVESTEDSIYLIDRNCRYLFVNKKYLSRLSLPIDKVINRPYSEFHSEKRTKEFTEKVKEIFKTGKSLWHEHRSQRDDRYFLRTLSPIKELDGKVTGATVISKDITERKEVEQMKSDFVSLVSHQLKTPVAIIKGYIENMLVGLTGNLAAKQKEYLQEMQKISSENYRLISNLLNVSRIERGVIAVDIQPIKLKEIIDLSLRDYRKSIKEKGLALNLEEIDDEIMVLADKDKMTEALKNVIDNAVKFTDKGSITINIKTKSEEGFAVVEVIDTGKGISPDLLNKLFTKDQILSGTTVEGSCGLGLYIAKEFMKLQHGDISATSVVGKGSSFIFKVPLVK